MNSLGKLARPKWRMTLIVGIIARGQVIMAADSRTSFGTRIQDTAQKITILDYAAAPTNGGWKDRLLTTNAGAYCWTNYTIMADELGQSPKVVVCPSDKRIAATNFIGKGSPEDHGNADFDNTKISYFVGVQADRGHPNSILMGDRNIGPGAVPDPDYGFSPADGNGKDVVIGGPVCWSLRIHSNGKPAGAGNVLLCDGSVQQVTSRELQRNCLKAALDEAKTQAGTKSAVGIRLIFP